MDRSSMRAAALAAALSAGLAGPVGAQEPDPALRGRALGQVTDREGKPWAGVEVVLVSRPIPHNPDVGEEDRVTATTDADGRFVAQVLRGRPYSAWAWGSAGPDGRRATSLCERVFVQRAIVLREARALRERLVRLTELGRWAAHAPFEVRVIDEGENRQVRWLRVADDGRVTLPPLVGPRATIDVIGTKPCRWPIARKVLEGAAGDEVSIELPILRTSTCFAQGFDSRKPCAGAEVLLKIGESMFPVGVTDADGKLRLDLPPRPPASVAPDVSAFVVAPGYIAGNCMPVSGGGVAREKPEVPDGLEPEDLFANLTPGREVHGRVLGVGGEPLAGAQLWCCGMSSNSPSHSSRSYGNWSRTVTADESGRFVVAGWIPTHGVAAHLILRERDHARLPPKWRPGLLPVVFAPLDGRRGEGTSQDPILVDLCTMCPIELQVADPTGAPAEGVELSFQCLGDAVATPWSFASDALADPRGALRILVPGQRKLGMRATRGLAMLVRALETSPGHADAGPAVGTFTLPEPAGIPGILQRKNGDPAPGYQVHASKGDNAALDWKYVGQPAGPLADGARNAVRVFVPDDPMEGLHLTNLICKSVVTDAEGRFHIPMPVEAVPQLMLFAAKAGARSFHESIRLNWTGEAVTDVTFKLRFE